MGWQRNSARFAQTEELTSDADVGQVGKEPEDVEYPENYDDNDDRVKNGFYRSLHGNEAVDEPEYDSYNDQHNHKIN
jgi:hypothetical protein